MDKGEALKKLNGMRNGRKSFKDSRLEIRN
jgi:hypothetical protein